MEPSERQRERRPVGGQRRDGHQATGAQLAKAFEALSAFVIRFRPIGWEISGAPMKKANDGLIGELASADPLAKEIIDSQAAYLKKARAWTKISDQSYLESMEQLQ